jgi:hypothetical protein
MIQDYADSLLAQLPERLATEVADGLADAYETHLARGLSPDQAARATVAEFGDARDIVRGFAQASPARRVARRLIVTGPAVGLCWAAALLAGHAWAWPVPALAPALTGVALIASVGALMIAVRSRGYRTVRRAGAVGCVGLALLDAAIIGLVLVSAPDLGWLLVLAALASATRLTCVARVLRPMLAYGTAQTAN